MLAGYKAVLFDFDFTLGDSSRGISEAVNYALLGIGRPSSTQHEINRLIGHTLRDIFLQLTGSEDDALYDQFRVLFSAQSDICVTPSTVIYDGVPELLRSLRKQGKHLGIISTKTRRRLDEILHRFQLTGEFSIVIGGGDVQNHKPHPEGLQMAIRQLSLMPADVLYVGDTVLDAEAARAAEVAFVAVLTGTTTRETFEPFEPVSILDNIAQLRSA